MKEFLNFFGDKYFLDFRGPLRPGSREILARLEAFHPDMSFARPPAPARIPAGPDRWGKAREYADEKGAPRYCLHINGENFEWGPWQWEREAPEGGEIRAEMPGKIIAVAAQNGDSVEKDQTIIVMEAMKMEQNLKAPGSGTLTGLEVKIGDIVGAGDLLAEIREDTTPA